MNPVTSLWPLCKQLKLCRFVDLTHTFDPAIPHFENTPPMSMRQISTIQKNGYSSEEFQFVGQWGTHVDAPSHFFEGKRAVDEIPVEEMVLPLAVIDIHEKAAQNPDYILLVEDILSWEDQNGRIPAGAFVALRTDWSKRWPDNAAMHNLDASGIPHSPGWSYDALSYLYEDCQIKASGQETIDPDPGFRAKETNWMCERYILSRNCYQIELLTRLDECPSTGAMAVCCFPKPRGASGFPARAFAICPSLT